MITDDRIEIRKYRESDRPFLTSTWLRNYKFSSYFAKRIKHEVFFKGHQAIIDRLLKKPSVTVLMACDKNHDDTMIGYLAYEPGEHPTIHFIYVKDTFRMMGIARALFNFAALDPEKIRFSHWTFVTDEFMRRWPSMIHDPYKKWE